MNRIKSQGIAIILDYLSLHIRSVGQGTDRSIGNLALQLTRGSMVAGFSSIGQYSSQHLGTMGWS